MKARALLAVVLLAGCAYRNEGPRAYPEWRLPVQPETHRCARVAAVGKRSVKKGIGIVLVLSGSSCPARLERAEIAIGGRRYPAASLTKTQFVLSAGTEVFVYVPFELDNEAHWNAGERDGTLSVWLTAGPDDRDDRPLEFAMEHVMPDREQRP